MLHHISASEIQNTTFAPRILHVLGCFLSACRTNAFRADFSNSAREKNYGYES